MEHILETVLGVPPDSVIHRALAYDGFEDPLDVVAADYKTLDSLEYYDSANNLVKIHKDAAWLLKLLKQFVYFHQEQGNVYCGDSFWTNITKAHFDTFRKMKGFDTSLILENLMPLTILTPSPADIPNDEKNLETVCSTLR